jgi:PhnB protein
MAKKIKKKSAKKTVKKAAKNHSAKKAVKRSAKKAAKKKPVKKAASKKPAAPKPELPTVGINPYLTFPGNCEEAFNFYRSVFGGNFPYIGRFNEMPPQEGQPPMPESEGSKIMHISLHIGKHSILMGSDSSEAFGHATNIGNNFSISINATSEAEADKLYNGLSAGGQTTMPMSKTFWGSYFGMLTDKFGIQWMVSYDAPKK